LKQFLITLAGVFVGLLLFVVIVPMALIGMAAGSAASSAKPVSDSVVLSLDLREPFADQRQPGLFASLSGQPSVLDVVQRLKAAEDDSHIKGLILRAGSGMTPAHAEEIRQAITRFKASGKFVYAHSQGFNGTGLTGYYVVANADEIWMQPDSSFFASGIRMENTFAKRLLDNISVSADFEAFYEYKNAPSTFTQTDYTAAHREAETGLIQSLYSAITAGIAVDRKRTPEQIRTMFEAGPYNANEAMKAGFVDKLGMPEDAEDAAMEKAGDGTIEDFWSYAPMPEMPSGPTIAVIGGEGGILEGVGQGGSPFGSDPTIYSDDLTRAILEAIEDEDVKAIVLRVDSPGGSATASDQIWAAVERAKKAGKPVVVSMSGYAASGGYFISAGADEIVAQPTTITGSIGVFYGKFVTEGGMERLGINNNAIQVGGDFVGAFTDQERWSEAQRTEIRQSMTETYNAFTQKVADGRGIPIERVREIAKGRVWTGAQAKSLGLVDYLGGLETAIARAKALAEIPADEEVALSFYPRARSTIEEFQSFFGVSSDAARAMAVLGAISGDETVSRLLRAQAMAQREGAQAEMEPVTVR
jgi:protease IV